MTAQPQIVRASPRLPERQEAFHYGHVAAALTMLAVTGAAVAAVMGRSWVLVASPGVLGLAVVITVGRLRQARAEASDRALEEIGRFVTTGSSLDRSMLTCRRWSRGWPGAPRVVVVRHQLPEHQVDSRLWSRQVAEVLERRFSARFEPRATRDHRRVRFTAKGVVEASPEISVARARLHRTTRELLGPTATVFEEEVVDGDLKSFRVQHQNGTRLAASGYRRRVEGVVSTVLPGRWRAVWDLEGDQARFELRPTLPDCVYLPAEDLASSVPDPLKNYRSVSFKCAVDEDQAVIEWFPARVPHALFVGSTGTGKTSELYSVIVQVARRGWPVWILDAKRIEFLGLRTWPNIQMVAGSVEQQVAMVYQAWNLMEHRYKLIEAGTARSEDFEPLLVVMDEYAEFRMNLLEWYSGIKVKGDPAKPPTFGQVGSLLRKARTARIHVIVSTQRPDVELLGSGEQRDNLGFRISMGRLSPKGAEMMWENASVGVSLPRDRTGRAMASGPDGPREVQCYRFPDMDSPPDSPEAAVIDSLRPATETQPRLVIEPPTPRTRIGSDGEEIEEALRHTDYMHATWHRASDRPDLDPLATAGIVNKDQGRELGSPLALLGILDGYPDPTQYPHQSGPTSDIDESDPDPAHVLDADDDEDGYDLPIGLTAEHLQPGDLIQVDGDWVTVDENPIEDPLDPDCLLVAWRSDDDEAGSLSVNPDEYLNTRKPTENGEEYA